MISDDEVAEFFRERLAKQGRYGGDPMSLQIFRGASSLEWKGQHAAGCFRHFTVFNNFRAIPEYCFDCCKVVIEPRSVLELFKLLLLFDRPLLQDNNTRKCICETREYCSGTYKGFIYCRGVDEAVAIGEKMRELIAREISPGIPVTVKRGCSEFEHAYPGYAQIGQGVAAMSYREEWRRHEEFVDKNATFRPPEAVGGGAVSYGPTEVFATHFWLRYAATIGDTSYLKITGGPVPPIPQLKRPPFAGCADA